MPERAAPDAQFEQSGLNVTGSVRNQEISGGWNVALRGSSLQLTQDGRVVEVPTSTLDGTSLEGDSLTLFMAGGDRIVLYGSGRLNELVAGLDAVELQVGEMMRASRTLGSRRARPGAEHDTFFAPFLAARGRLEAEGGRSAVDLPEVRLLRSAVVDALATIASSRFPDQAADRRALIAELDDHSERLFEALDHLDSAAERVRRAAPETRYVAWREWTRALEACFSRAEGSWMAALPALREGEGEGGGGATGHKAGIHGAADRYDAE